MDADTKHSLSTLLGMNEAAVIIGVTTSQLRNLCIDGKIEHGMVAGRTVFDPRDVERYRDERNARKGK